MADNTLEREENQEVCTSPKLLRCRFHETEEYTIFCKDCKDFLCFKCIGQLHNKHELSQVQDADEAIRTEMCGLLLKNKYAEHLNSLSDKVSYKEKELVQDEESLTREIRTSVDKMKQNIDFTEKRLLSELRNGFEGYQISLQDKKTNIKNIQDKIAYLDIKKLPEYSLNHIINSLSEMKACSSKCDKILNRQKPYFQSALEFSIGKIILSDKRLQGDVSALPSCSDISIQTDLSDDSDTEWFDAEEISMDCFIENSSDEVINEYPMTIQLKKDIKLIKKIVPITKKDTWIISGRTLRKIVDYSLDEKKYAENVDDIVVLKDGCVLILNCGDSFIMKLLTNGRLVRFANVGKTYVFPHYYPYCICISGDIVIIYLWSSLSSAFLGKTSRSLIIWMNTDGIVTDRLLFQGPSSKQPYSIQNVELGLCILYRVENNPNLHCIEVIGANSDKYNTLYEFEGIYGFDPDTNFECEGMYVDKACNILVSDYRHHSVYVLNKKLQYKKTLFDARNDLDKPTAIGMFDNHLWVVDGNQIFIFNYECVGNS